MRLKINHKTNFLFSEPPAYLVQRLHLQPADFATQKTIDWKIEAPGMENAVCYVGQCGNIIHLVTSDHPGTNVEITSSGEVETHEASGVVTGLPENVPAAVFLRQTPLTRANETMIQFGELTNLNGTVLDHMHRLMISIHEAVIYEVGQSHAYTTATEAFANGRGVCQDHAHIMIGIARAIGIPARYVTGYLVTGIGASSAAAHAWAELRIPDLGWVGFDPANGQSPTEQYVRVAAGLDAAAVTPLKGSRKGTSSKEEMTVSVTVEIAG
jgi:transglutaminase-like putative cysteine protease